MTPSEKLVSDVARAIAEAEVRNPDARANATDHVKKSWNRAAQAAIAIVLQHAAEVAESMILYSGQDIANAILALSDQDREV